MKEKIEPESVVLTLRITQWCKGDSRNPGAHSVSLGSNSNWGGDTGGGCPNGVNGSCGLRGSGAAKAQWATTQRWADIPGNDLNTLHKSRKSNERCERKKGKEEIEKLKSNQVPYFSKTEFQKELVISPFRNLVGALNISWKPFPGEGI